MPEPTPFGLRLKVLREAAGLSQYALALRSEVPVDTIRSIEQGRSTQPAFATAEKLADALGVSVEEFRASR